MGIVGSVRDVLWVSDELAAAYALTMSLRQALFGHLWSFDSPKARGESGWATWVGLETRRAWPERQFW